MNGCAIEKTGQNGLLLFDFESDEDLDRIDWQCHVLYSLSNEHATHGRNSLKMDLYPAPYPGLSPKLDRTDWKGFKKFVFDVYNPQHEAVLIAVRIDDTKKHPEYKDRYNMSFDLRPGMNHIAIPIDALITSGTRRLLDVGNIYRFLIFTVQPGNPLTLYVDNIRLAM